MPQLGITPLPADAARPEGDGFLFRRTWRSGQGRLTKRPTNGLVIVLISPKHPEQAQVLRDWGDLVHISEIVAASVDGYRMITPYEIDGDGPRFLHLYELDSDDPETTFKAMTPLVRARLDDEAYEQWAFHPELRIDYVSTYRRLA